MGPLHGLKIIEIAGIGPGPFAGMMLSDMGAEVLRVARPASASWGNDALDLLNRGRRSISVDLKHPEARGLILDLVDGADGLFEGFRPGVMEKLGLGPEPCLERNPRLVYGRMTGFGQDGPLAHAAGHDLNYIALAGALDHMGRRGQPPTPPLNIVGDFGGGGLMLAFGMVCALLERARSGRGQVVDAAMVDGTATLMTIFHAMLAVGAWSPERGTNLLDSGAHFYDVYETSDGRYVSIGAIEPQFYAELCRRIGIDPASLPPQMDRTSWPVAKERLAEIFRTRTRDEWCALLEGTDACFAPVLSMAEAPHHPHNRARATFVEVAGVVQPRPTPRFSRTDSGISRPPVAPGADTDEALRDWGIAADRIAALRTAKAIY